MSKAIFVIVLLMSSYVCAEEVKKQEVADQIDKVLDSIEMRAKKLGVEIKPAWELAVNEYVARTKMQINIYFITGIICLVISIVMAGITVKFAYVCAASTNNDDPRIVLPIVAGILCVFLLTIAFVYCLCAIDKYIDLQSPNISAAKYVMRINK